MRINLVNTRARATVRGLLSTRKLKNERFARRSTKDFSCKMLFLIYFQVKIYIGRKGEGAYARLVS